MEELLDAEREWSPLLQRRWGQIITTARTERRRKGPEIDIHPTCGSLKLFNRGSAYICWSSYSCKRLETVYRVSRTCLQKIHGIGARLGPIYDNCRDGANGFQLTTRVKVRYLACSAIIHSSLTCNVSWLLRYFTIRYWNNTASVRKDIIRSAEYYCYLAYSSYYYRSRPVAALRRRLLRQSKERSRRVGYVGMPVCLAVDGYDR